MLNNYPMMNAERFEGIEKRVKSAFHSILGFSDYEIDSKCKAYRKAVKKFRKAKYMEENHRTFSDEIQTENLINFFRNYREENGDSWKDVFVFNTTNKEAVIQQLEKMWVQIDGSNWTSEYDCTGRAFYRACDFYELEDRIIVTQWGGLDV